MITGNKDKYMIGKGDLTEIKQRCNIGHLSYINSCQAGQLSFLFLPSAQQYLWNGMSCEAEAAT